MEERGRGGKREVEKINGEGGSEREWEKGGKIKGEWGR